MKNNQFRLAKAAFQVELGGIPQDNITEMVDIKNKIAYCFLKLNQYDSAEKIYEEVVDVLKGKSEYKQLYEVQSHYLLRHYLKLNLDKALTIGRQIYDNSQIEFTDYYKILFKINMATSYLLDGDIEYSKSILNEIRTQELPDSINAVVMNNFAVACWWDKYPNYLDYDPDFIEDDFECNEFTEKIKNSKDMFFKISYPAFKTALYYFELAENNGNMDKVSDFLKIEKPSDVDFFYYKDKKIFKNQYSGIVMLNIAEMLLSTNKESFKEGYFYLISAINILESNNIHGMFERALAILGLAHCGSNNFKKSELLFKKSIAINKLNDSWNKTPLIYSLKNYGLLLNKMDNSGSKYIELAHELEDKQEFWHKKLIHLIIPK